MLLQMHGSLSSTRMATLNLTWVTCLPIILPNWCRNILTLLLNSWDCHLLLSLQCLFHLCLWCLQLPNLLLLLFLLLFQQNSRLTPLHQLLLQFTNPVHKYSKQQNSHFIILYYYYYCGASLHVMTVTLNLLFLLLLDSPQVLLQWNSIDIDY